jgi:hypothetical protein
MEVGHMADEDTTEITERIQAHRRGEISDDELVQYLAHDARYKRSPENPYKSDDPKWWQWSTDEKPFTPGSFEEVERARDRGMLDRDIYERVLHVFYKEMT